MLLETMGIRDDADLSFFYRAMHNKKISHLTKKSGFACASLHRHRVKPPKQGHKCFKRIEKSIPNRTVVNWNNGPKAVRLTLEDKNETRGAS